MLTLQTIKADPEYVIKRLAVKGFDGSTVIRQILDLDAERRSLQQKTESDASRLKKISSSIGSLMKEGRAAEAEAAKSEVNAIKEETKKMQARLGECETEMHNLLLTVPNMPCEAVPEGLTADDNVVEKTGGAMPELGEDALPHWELAKKYNLIDFELGVKVTGAGFPFYIGKGARMQRALIQFFLDEAWKAGYTEVEPPFVVNEASGYGTGQLPDKEGQMYHVTVDNLYLIPTAEVPVTNMYRDVIIAENDLPKKNCAYSPCWRREAGSYGKDVRGLNRLHQFDKVEIVRIEKPENSYAALEEMKDHVQGLLEKLGLPWHILRLCGGDMSFTSAITFDFEVWSAAQKRWLEVSSVSNFETYQANRLKCRYKGADKKTHLCHTLNGSALALPRIMAALLENFQTPEGIIVPECLRKYTGFDIID
ncbi:MAG: serine--tRNA ligase [Bacteroides sp.]|nr:serine--tRNA ligase [Bacteroidales bacterium]MBD5302130.1 serine--tRNA ligase [Bacteroides sp.]MBD5205277.1 serine--tRNA ligase [Bacteroidales bacterium]MBD5222872.1 serine--tRNA ligase [Bacteroidales bacterium]MBD5305660.1 serine--tRNA ligase [Bacteroides sp.]